MIWRMQSDEEWSEKIDEAMTSIAKTAGEMCAGVASAIGRDDAGRPTFIVSVLLHDIDENDPEPDPEQQIWFGCYTDLSDPENISPIWGLVDAVTVAGS